jgi:transglutaminase-like putative cysteine protease
VIRFALFRRKPEPTLEQRPFDLLCLTVAVVLGAHAPHLPWWLTLGLAVTLGLRWWQRSRQRTGRASPYFKLPLVALLAGAVVFHYDTLFGRAPGAAMVSGLLVLKLLETETPRDARVGSAFACFALMSALLFDQSMVATLLVTLGLLPALATLRALQPARLSTTLPGELLPVLGLLGVSLPLALVAFVFLPRLSSPLWGAPNAGQGQSGLSPDMSPGDFSEVLLDNRPAMRVTFDGAPPAKPQRYFRAYVLSNYDGRTWRGQESNEPPALAEHHATVRYTISLEATGQRALPALDVPVDAPPNAQLGPDRELRVERPVNDPRTYQLSSALDYRLQTQLSDRDRRRALQLPAGFDPRTRALGERWRAQYGSDDMAIIRAAMSLFHDGGFSYLLTPPPLGNDAIDDFLFSTHQGFCEHYSSAFTVLMRTAGIPARVVTGYQGGYWNAMGNYLLVRQSDAHAWSEVWLPQRGWIRFDPTAAVRPERVYQGAAAANAVATDWSPNQWMLGWRNRWDIVNQWWNQGVIGFDTLRQHGLLTPFGVDNPSAGTLGLLLTIGGSLFALLGLSWALWKRPDADQARVAMRLLEKRLAAAGVARRQGEGPQHYFSRAARALPSQRSELEQLMRTYLDLRYAHEEPPADLLKNFRQAARDFRPRRVVK